MKTLLIVAAMAASLVTTVNCQVEDLGSGLAGTNGVPTAEAHGTLLLGAPLEIVVTNAAPNASGTLVFGGSTSYLPIFGGILVPTPEGDIPVTTDANGNAEVVVTTWDPEFASPIYFQFVVVDSGAPSGFAFSNALSITALSTPVKHTSSAATAAFSGYTVTFAGSGVGNGAPTITDISITASGGTATSYTLGSQPPSGGAPPAGTAYQTGTNETPKFAFPTGAIPAGATVCFTIKYPNSNGNITHSFPQDTTNGFTNN